IVMRDSEGGGRSEVYLTPTRLRQMQESSAQHLAHLEHGFRQVGLDHVALSSPSVEACYEALAGFFEARRRTR
ncbi:MAG TPA: hypothetical protein PLB78_04040, partial [Anaerolineae bacterium]|nr:hypothetical protein [Anaerolineae bacterium]